MVWLISKSQGIRLPVWAGWKRSSDDESFC